MMNPLSSPPTQSTLKHHTRTGNSDDHLTRFPPSFVYFKDALTLMTQNVLIFYFSTSECNLYIFIERCKQ